MPQYCVSNQENDDSKVVDPKTAAALQDIKQHKSKIMTKVMQATHQHQHH